MSRFRIPVHRIQEIVQSPKRLADGARMVWTAHGDLGKSFDEPVELLDGPYCDLRFIGRAGRVNLPGSYEVSFLIEARRVRGIGYSPVARNNFRAKDRIPAGWHQNICDPNLPTDHPGYNRHEPLPDLDPADFVSLVRVAANLWRIDLGWEEGLL